MSTNKSKIPLTFKKEDKKHATSTSISMEAPKTIYEENTQTTPLQSGHQLVEELQITQEELEMITKNEKITDITEFGSFAPTSEIIDAIDATQFQTLEEVQPIVDNIELETKDIKTKK